MKKKKSECKQYSVSVLIGLLALQTLSACVKSDQTLGTNCNSVANVSGNPSPVPALDFSRPSNVDSGLIKQRGYDCVCKCTPSGLKNDNIPNPSNMKINDFKVLFDKALSHQTFSGNDGIASKESTKCYHKEEVNSLYTLRTVRAFTKNK